MIWVGTSGYNYPEWKGSFYPADLAQARMLPYYAARFPTVEINYTFYRMPTEKLVAGWAAQTPSPYRLTLKAPRRITHDSRLRNCGPLLATFCGVAGSLGDKLGALLFQLPPNAKKDLPLFDAFLDDLPPGARAAFEFGTPPGWTMSVRAAAAAEPRALRGGQREDVGAGDDHRRLRLPGCATRAMPKAISCAGRTPSPARRPGAATCSCISSTRKKARARHSHAAHGPPRPAADAVTARSTKSTISDSAQ